MATEEEKEGNTLRVVTLIVPVVEVCAMLVHSSDCSRLLLLAFDDRWVVTCGGCKELVSENVSMVCCCSE